MVPYSPNAGLRLNYHSHQYGHPVKNNRLQEEIANGRCERVARERAGGERGFLFAGRKESRVHPSNKAASEAAAATLRRLNAI